MRLDEIVEYWSAFGHDPGTGFWSHPDDRVELALSSHTLNLDHPTGPYVGRITTAPVVILGANGGYHPAVTPSEFPNQDAVDTFLARAANPSDADWSNVAPYYDTVNWGPFIKSGDAVWVNASPYRSPRISTERRNQRLIHRLPSSAFLRRWLLEAALPLAARGERLVIVKRPGLWQLPSSVTTAPGVVVDRAPISKHITGAALSALNGFLAGHDPAATQPVPADPIEAIPAEPVSPPAYSRRTPPAAAPSSLVPGMLQADVAPLIAVCRLLGLDLADPNGQWPGYGKVVRLKGDRSIYINGKHADVRAETWLVAKWDAAGLGHVRPDNDRYLRVMLDASGPRA